jgi:hypothetical protein
MCFSKWRIVAIQIAATNNYADPASSFVHCESLSLLALQEGWWHANAYNGEQMNSSSGILVANELFQWDSGNHKLSMLITTRGKLHTRRLQVVLSSCFFIIYIKMYRNCHLVLKYVVYLWKTFSTQSANHIYTNFLSHTQSADEWTCTSITCIQHKTTWNR